MTTMEHLWRAVCECLDEELERQQTVKVVCEAQYDAVRIRSIEHLQAKTDALECLIHEANVAEKARLRAVRALVEYLELPVERQTLTELVRIAPAPFGRRLDELQRELKALLPAIRAIIADTQQRLRLGSDILDRTIQTLVPDDCTSKVSYRTQRRPDSVPVLIDSRG